MDETTNNAPASGPSPCDFWRTASVGADDWAKPLDALASKKKCMVNKSRYPL
jgi:hypothetical protein